MDIDIEINMPFITMEVMDILLSIVNTSTIPPVKSYKGLVTAGHYLGIDLLVIIGSPQYGYFIKEYPDINIIDIEPDQISDTLRYAVMNNYISMVEYLIRNGVDLNIHGDNAIWEASGYGHLQMVNLLLKDERINPQSGGNFPIAISAEYGHLSVVDRLLQDPRVDPSVFENSTIIITSQNGHIDVVRRLLLDPRVNPGIGSIRRASENGHLEIVKLLLQDSRISIDDFWGFNYWIHSVEDKGYLEIGVLLKEYIKAHNNTL